MERDQRAEIFESWRISRSILDERIELAAVRQEISAQTRLPGTSRIANPSAREQASISIKLLCASSPSERDQYTIVPLIFLASMLSISLVRILG